jgi:hypothetical protein
MLRAGQARRVGSLAERLRTLSAAELSVLNDALDVLHRVL